MKNQEAKKPDSRQVRVSQDVLLAVMGEQDPQNPLESFDSILRRKYGLEPKTLGGSLRREPGTPSGQRATRRSAAAANKKRHAGTTG